MGTTWAVGGHRRRVRVEWGWERLPGGEGPPAAYAACLAASQGTLARGLWGPSLVSTSTRNLEAPAAGSTSPGCWRVTPPIGNLFVVQRRIRLRPRYLRDVSQVDTRTTIQGEEISAPVCISPTGFHCLAWPDGEMSTARGGSSPRGLPPGALLCAGGILPAGRQLQGSLERLREGKWLESRRVGKGLLHACSPNTSLRLRKIPVFHNKEWIGG